MINIKVHYNDKQNLHETFETTLPSVPRKGDIIATDNINIDESNPLYEFDELIVEYACFCPGEQIVSIHCVTRYESKK